MKVLVACEESQEVCKAPEQERKMRTLYRLVYKNGDHGAWDDDIDRIREYANFFHAEIEIKRIRNE